MKKKKEISIVRSSAAEYLTFITATGKSDVNAVYFDENVWLTQKMMGLLYDVETHTINYHLKKIFVDGELDEDSVIRKFRITASDGKSYNTNHYNLKAIIAVGNKVDSPRAVQFRKWANGIIEEFTIKGFTMDDERLQKTILKSSYKEFVRYGYLREGFIKKLQIFMQRALITILNLKQPDCFLPESRISYTGQYMEKLQQK